ncbi:MAG TPA: methylmalonyl-CoA epimerase [Anaerolineae bacterium]|nr:methylmalonyl-CoA epimerase [Anaerolineae bacterium]
MKIKKINHVAIAVSNIEEALSFWCDALGLEMDHIEKVTSQKARVAFLPVGDSEVELVQPTSDDSGTARFLRERGPGMHHLCFEVEDILDALKQLKAKGVRLINEKPLELEDRKMAFIHPKSTYGVLVELYQII